MLRSAIALAAFLLLIGLGTWQVERLSWKEALLATLAQRLAAAPAPLPPATSWTRLDPAEDEFRRVAFTATFLHDREGLVYSAGSGLRARASGPGYWVFTPARLADGTVLMVDRGFVPEGRRDPAARPAGQMPGEITIVGVLRWPEQRSLFSPADDPARNLWFVRDPVAIATAKGLTVAPFYVDQEAPQPPGGLPAAGPLRPNIPNHHLQYALTWYALAVALAVMFGLWAYGARPLGAGEA